MTWRKLTDICTGVPRVLKSGTIDQEQDEEWEKGGFVEYMRSHRVNLNVRQVHHS